jgi:hypothetical protein
MTSGYCDFEAQELNPENRNHTYEVSIFGAVPERVNNFE